MEFLPLNLQQEIHSVIHDLLYLLYLLSVELIIYGIVWVPMDEVV